MTTNEPRATGIFAVLLIASWTAAAILIGYVAGLSAGLAQ